VANDEDCVRGERGLRNGCEQEREEWEELGHEARLAPSSITSQHFSMSGV
jgi:hypothetical protein